MSDDAAQYAVYLAPQNHMLSSPAPTPSDLVRVVDMIRYAISRFETAEVFYGHGTTCALDEAAALVLGALKLPPDLPETYLQAQLTADEARQVAELIERRTSQRIPVPYLLGECWYAGRRFTVSPDVLVPRSPIFELMETEFSPWLSEPPERALDLCTGSGCLAILLAETFPGTLVDASDLSADALKIAQQNIERHGFSGAIELLEGDGLLACGDRQYDLIVTNPPYVPADEYADLPAEYTHEPRMGLESGEDGLSFVRQMLHMVPANLNPGGLLVCEVGSAAGYLIEQFPDWPFTWVEFETGGDGVFVISREELLAATKGI